MVVARFLYVGWVAQGERVKLEEGEEHGGPTSDTCQHGATSVWDPCVIDPINDLRNIKRQTLWVSIRTLHLCPTKVAS
jgi:hypothetical protein